MCPRPPVFAFLLAFLIPLAACTKADSLVVTNAAADACQLVELITGDGAARSVCLAVDALDKLLPDLLAAERDGRGVELIIRAADGTEERLAFRSAEVSALSSRVGAAQVRAKAARKP